MRSSRYAPALAAFAIALLMAPSATAATRKVAVEGTNWFWERQHRTTPSDATKPVTDAAGQDSHCPREVPLPLCPDPVVGAPNPHEPGSLPVAMTNGLHEKVSAVRWDLSFIPAQGAVIKKFVFEINESNANRDKPQRSPNADGKIILACQATTGWAESEDQNDEMKDAPKFDCAKAVAGTRKTVKDQAYWRFDITKIAKSWGANPFSANGVVLAGKKSGEGAQGTWQIVLAGPRRDDANTPQNEAQQSADFVRTTIEYAPNPEPTTTPTSTPPYTPPSTTSNTNSFDYPSGSTTYSDPNAYSSGTTTGTPATGTTTPFAPESTTPGAPVPPAAGGSTQAAGGAEPVPTMPGYVWALLPLALLAWSMVRRAVLPAATRGRGVVALIREQNLARRGRPLADTSSPLAGMAAKVKKVVKKIKLW